MLYAHSSYFTSHEKQFIMTNNCIPIIPNKTMDILAEAMDILLNRTDIIAEEKQSAITILNKVNYQESLILLKQKKS